MQRIVVDTNVIVSSLIQRGNPNLIINDLFIEQKFLLCISGELMAGYFEVLARPKFSKFPDFFIRAETLLVEIESKLPPSPEGELCGVLLGKEIVYR